MGIYRRPESPYWQIKIKHRGKVHQFTTGVTDEQEAQDIHDEYRLNLRRRDKGLSTNKAIPMFFEFVDTFKEHIETLENERTKKFYRDRLAFLLRYKKFARVSMDDFSNLKINAFVAWAKTQPNGRGGYTSVATINRTLATLRVMTNLSADEYGHVKRSIQGVEGENIREGVLSDDQERAYLEAAPALLRDVFTFGIDLGCRPGEIYALRHEDIDWDNAVVYIREGKTKNARRPLPASERVLQIAWDRAANGSPWLFHRPKNKSQAMNHASIKKAHRTVCERLGLEGIVIHSARHISLTRLAGKVPDHLLAMFAGHHSASFTKDRYVHPKMEDMRAAVTKATHSKKKVS